VKSLPLRMATCDGAQVALQQSLILRPGNKQCIKNYEGGSFFGCREGSFFGWHYQIWANPTPVAKRREVKLRLPLHRPKQVGQVQSEGGFSIRPGEVGRERLLLIDETDIWDLAGGGGTGREVSEERPSVGLRRDFPICAVDGFKLT